jgi:hypothetical protein
MQKIELIPEICCDDCGDVIHNHLQECPACKDWYASTDAYGELEIGEEFGCEKCGAKFKLIGWYEAEWINEGDKTTDEQQPNLQAGSKN